MYGSGMNHRPRGGRYQNHHSSIYGTEQDPHNCSFFLRIGACRHGSCCPKKHTWPTFSNTLLLEHIWMPSKTVSNKKKRKRRHFERFLEDLLEEMSKHGDVQETLTMENVGDHMMGNTFVKFADEDQAKRALDATQGRNYAGRSVIVKYSPVVDFENARCRDFVSGVCKRGNFCNFAHFCELPRWANQFMRTKVSDRHRNVGKRSRGRRKHNPFPVGGNRKERMECIERWNEDRKKDLRGAATVDSQGTTLNSSLNLFKPN